MESTNRTDAEAVAAALRGYIAIRKILNAVMNATDVFEARGAEEMQNAIEQDFAPYEDIEGLDEIDSIRAALADARYIVDSSTAFHNGVPNPPEPYKAMASAWRALRSTRVALTARGVPLPPADEWGEVD